MTAARIVEVPANALRAVCSGQEADFVIEGYIDPRPDASGLRDEGRSAPEAFGDHTGYYTLPSPRGIAPESRPQAAGGSIPRGEPYPVFHVTAITHRKDAVYPATIGPDPSG